MDLPHLKSGESLPATLVQPLSLMNPEHIKANRIAEATKISHLANKRIKTLLSCCATSAIQFNSEIRMYYQSRVAEGKNKIDKVILDPEHVLPDVNRENNELDCSN